MLTATAVTTASFITPPALLDHWQAHRRLTRRMIDAFPEDKFSTYSVGGMRPFSELASEMLAMAEPTVRGIVTGEWNEFSMKPAKTRAEVLKQWDASTERINELWPKIPAERFHEVTTAFGQYTMPVHGLVLYVIDNEIHHRGQGYVYLRSLGIEPPAFWQRD